MSHHPSLSPVHHDPGIWIRLIFSSQAAKGGVVRRSIAWMDPKVEPDRFVTEVRQRGFHLLATSSRLIAVGYREPLHLVF